ncbi:uncharacterized protein MONBRDRAFT_9122 [Monosiga brevicollis MX1]|uniref:SH2 domain-containing protein n=1 Tax=Monosiga brevicollis TaxID=81824 RepID=A9V255_MONBE|nr:uncharacterized protein MONBRDRAFT_9122 [Monosiga brevicollis MX1]EDQ88194.1 predicted protein [Monosiga brevicollis MX1]|eukprot:XP_001746787.1 hypothetical protein [Monosiga brevicollis MX1]
MARYYHGRITREEAVDRLLKEGVDGSFLLRMSTTQDGVYTLSLMQGESVRHIRIVNTIDGGYAISAGDPGVDSVWQLVETQMHNTLTSAYDRSDQVALRYPLKANGDVIAPDLLMSAGEAGIDAADFGDDVAAFLEGGVDAKALARQRSVKMSVRRPKDLKVASHDDPFAGLELPSDFDPDNLPENYIVPED